MNAAIEAAAEEAIAAKTFPGCVVGVVRADGRREIAAFGHLRYGDDATPVHEDTVYDLASVTKSIPVASLAALLAAEGKIRFGDPVVRYIPELQNDHGATVEDLLRYRIKGPRMSELAVMYSTFEQVRTHVLETGFEAPAGEPSYSNAPAFILGMVLERAGGEILPALAHKRLFEPLRMTDTTFFPHDRERVAPTEVVDTTEIHGIVHDESARAFAQRRRTVGHAGLFSTAPDLLDLLEALLNGSLQDVADAAEQGLGWQLEGRLFGSNTSKRAFGKTGFTGTSVVADPEKGVGLVILSNRTYPTRPNDASSAHSAMNEFRARIADTVFSS